MKIAGSDYCSNEVGRGNEVSRMFNPWSNSASGLFAVDECGCCPGRSSSSVDSQIKKASSESISSHAASVIRCYFGNVMNLLDMKTD